MSRSPCSWTSRASGATGRTDDHEFPDEVETQLKGALQRGHDVQAHLHPHWLHAERVDGPLAGTARHVPGRCARRPRAVARPGEGLPRGAALPGRPRLSLHRLPRGQLRAPARLQACLCGPRRDRVRGRLERRPGPRPEERGQQDRLPRLALAGERAADLRHLRGPGRDGAVRPAGRGAALWTRPPRREPRGRTIQSASGARRPSLFSRVFRLDPLELGPSAYRLQKITRRYLRRAGKDADFSFSSHPKAVGEPELEALVAYHAWLDRHYDVEAVTFRELAARLAAEPAE